MVVGEANPYSSLDFFLVRDLSNAEKFASRENVDTREPKIKIFNVPRSPSIRRPKSLSCELWDNPSWADCLFLIIKSIGTPVLTA